MSQASVASATSSSSVASSSSVDSSSSVASITNQIEKELKKEQHRAQFYKLMAEEEEKEGQHRLINEAEYQLLIAELVVAELKKSTKTQHKYAILRKFEILEAGNTKLLIKKRDDDEKKRNECKVYVTKEAF